MINNSVEKYITGLICALKEINQSDIELLSNSMSMAREVGSSIYLCGNGGSAANALHIANDFIYGAGGGVKGFPVEALTANSAVLTCLANDIGYEYIFSEQLKSKALSGDILIVLSGSGNSKNIVNAILEGNKIGMQTFAITGFDGGIAATIVKHSIHINVNDMQISEDVQLVIGHMCMKYLAANFK